jgi:type IV pilus assembly protein PilV
MHRRAFKNRGFTLLEVMVALLILSIGLLGLAAMQLTGMRYNTDAYARTQATIFAYDIIDRIRANPVGRINGNYNVANTAAANATIAAYNACSAAGCNCDGAACTSANLALNDLGKWYNAQATINQAAAIGGLPGADQNNRATIDVVVAGTTVTVTVTMNWRERDIPFSQTWVVQL